jgi:hypothetical protein
MFKKFLIKKHKTQESSIHQSNVKNMQGLSGIETLYLSLAYVSTCFSEQILKQEILSEKQTTPEFPNKSY